VPHWPSPYIDQIVRYAGQRIIQCIERFKPIDTVQTEG
jgi:hypothetical protein